MKPTSELISLQNKVAVVTGAAKGIGLGIAFRLHDAGARVIIADVDADAAQEAAHELHTKREKSAVAVRCDVTDPDDIKRVIAAATEEFGGLDIWINNAGIFPFTNLNELDDTTFEKVINVNLRGVYLGTKFAAERMISQGRGGRIINIASVDALHPSAVGLAAYDASKHGVWGFTKNTALELAQYDIYVNAIAPGGIATPGAAAISGGDIEKAKAAGANVPLGRIGEPDDIGKVALFLASDLASYMTGSMVVVDGGMLLK